MNGATFWVRSHAPAMKPLLIIPPAPARWPALLSLLQHQGAPWVPNMERRFHPGVPGATDAYAVMPSGGLILASAGINRCGDIGVLGHVFTHPDHRRRGYGRQVTEAALSWFDMTGGKWLYLTTTAELDEGLYWKFGFAPLHRAVWEPFDRIMMLRIGHGVTTEPLADATGDLKLRELTRADWPSMVALLQYRLGPDPRVPLGESAVNAEVVTLDLLAHLDRGAAHLLGAYQGSRLVALASVALPAETDRTYAVILPHVGAPPELREAAIAFAQSRGYAHVQFPMEALERAT